MDFRSPAGLLVRVRKGAAAGGAGAGAAGAGRVTGVVLGSADEAAAVRLLRDAAGLVPVRARER